MKMIFVSGEDDFSAMLFEQEVSGRSVADFISENFEEGEESSIEYSFSSDEINDGYDEDEMGEVVVTIDLFEFGDVDKAFINFIRDQIQDYDESKAQNFHFEDEIF